MASGGSPFGVAADIGGSIRVPALFCGVFGHKPSAGLIPNTGLWPSTSGEAQKLLAVGPLARRAEDLFPVLNGIMAGPDGWDTDHRRRWSLAIRPPRCRLMSLLVTVVEGSSLRPMSRDLRDARERAVGALAAAGARIRRISMPSWRIALLPFLATLQNTDSLTRRASTRCWKEAGRSSRMPACGQCSSVRATHTLPTRLAVLAEAIPAQRIGDA